MAPPATRRSSGPASRCARGRPLSLGVMWPWGLGLTAAQGRIGTVAVTAIYQSLGTKEEKRA